MRIIVVGAGAFGGWSALWLLRRGASVTLIDAWGPGHSRASSGGETRIIRGTHGSDRPYMELVTRSLEIWRESERRWDRPLFHPTGVLWLPGDDAPYLKDAVPLLNEFGYTFEQLTAQEASRRFPQIQFDASTEMLLETGTGYLLARRACQAVLEAFEREGGEFRLGSIRVGSGAEGGVQFLELPDGTRLTADRYLFACGPWLGQLFPDVLGPLIRPTRQEVFFFGTPAADGRYNEGGMPTWIERGTFYGIPGSDWRGFKIADDAFGPAFDPTAGDRTPTATGIAAARAYLARRFPGMKDAPLVEARVCQYENSPDGHFIIDQHPRSPNAWIMGGGSGRGFKHGPALGERMAQLILGERKIDPFFSLARFAHPA